ncbi:hypothetical protein Q427_05955 [Halomonas sp. BC04]|nr:hypothetical protein Q427_05955 [Halomonas sp. BC04]
MLRFNSLVDSFSVSRTSYSRILYQPMAMRARLVQWTDRITV